MIPTFTTGLFFIKSCSSSVRGIVFAFSCIDKIKRNSINSSLFICALNEFIKIIKHIIHEDTYKKNRTTLEEEVALLLDGYKIKFDYIVKKLVKKNY